MTIHPFYIGCDISKSHLDIFHSQDSTFSRLANDSEAIQAWIASLADGGAHVILEATGVYDRTLRLALSEAGLAFSRVNPTRARRFAQAAGFLAKTDRVDAAMLAEMGRRMTPPADPPLDPGREALTELQKRKDQLVLARAREKNQMEAAISPSALASGERMIAFLGQEIEQIEAEIDALLADRPDLAADEARLRTVPGVGPVTAAVLIGQLPELGQRSPKQIAALAGLAPINNDSGAKRGKRSIRGGRSRVRKALYMAAVTAACRHPKFKAVYQRIKTRSGSAKVAYIAVARKILITLNAMQRDKKMFNP